MSLKYKISFLLLSVILFYLLLDRLILTTANIEIELNPETLLPSHTSELTLSVNPKNLLKFRTPFRDIPVRFEVTEGSNLVELFPNSDGESVVIRSKGIEGEAVVSVYFLKNNLLLRKVMIRIVSNGTA